MAREWKLPVVQYWYTAGRSFHVLVNCSTILFRFGPLRGIKEQHDEGEGHGARENGRRKVILTRHDCILSVLKWKNSVVVLLRRFAGITGFTAKAFVEVAPCTSLSSSDEFQFSLVQSMK